MLTLPAVFHFYEMFRRKYFSAGSLGRLVSAALASRRLSAPLFELLHSWIARPLDALSLLAFRAVRDDSSYNALAAGHQWLR